MNKECQINHVEDRHEQRLIDLVANLARRVTSLELQLVDTQRNLETTAEELANARHRIRKHEDRFAAVEDKVEMVLDDIVALDERTQPKQEPINTSESVTVPKWLIQVLSKSVEVKR